MKITKNLKYIIVKNNWFLNNKFVDNLQDLKKMRKISNKKLLINKANKIN